MPGYEIIDWIYNAIKEQDFKSKEDVLGKINDYAKFSADGGKNWKQFSDDEDWFNESSDKTGRKISDEVDNDNKDYLKRIRADINSANTKDGLNQITLEDYRDDDILETEIETKKQSLEGPISVEIEGEEFEIPTEFQRGRPKDLVSAEVRSNAGEVLQDIVETGESNNLNALKAIDISNMPKGLINFLEREKRETIEEVEKELKEEVE